MLDGQSGYGAIGIGLAVGTASTRASRGWGRGKALPWPGRRARIPFDPRVLTPHRIAHPRRSSAGLLRQQV